MCTAITYHTKDHYFGRNLDYERTFGEQIVITPRKYPFVYKCVIPGEISGADKTDGGINISGEHYAMIGMGIVADEYPLYFDAINEKGLGMAGLHFVGNAFYEKPKKGRDRSRKDLGDSVSDIAYDIAPYELIPWILSQCETVSQARELLAQTRLVSVPFSDRFPLSPLHFMIADRENAIVVEPVREGLKIYDNPVGVLTNNPPFPFHMTNLNNYMNLTADIPTNRFSKKLPLKPYSRGMGAIGLPGDMSSVSRFVRAAFVRANSVSGEGEQESVNQFFHILGSVEQIRGCVCPEENKFEITTYSCCCNLDRGIYYYRTYEDSCVRKADMRDMDLDGEVCMKYAR